MTQIDSIKASIESLSKEDFVNLREWIAELDWQHWDEQLEKDVATGKLDFLRDEATSAKENSKLRDL